MLDQKVAALLNEQVNKEFYSAYLYLDFSIYYEETGLDGFANWYKIQAQEERDHAMLMLQYLQNNGAKVTLEAVAKPDKALTDKLEVLKLGLEHEQYVRARRRRTPRTLSKRWSSSARTPRVSTCSTARWRPGPIRRPP